MQLSFIALSLVFSLVSNSYKFSVELCFRCAFQVKKIAFKRSSRRHPDLSTWHCHGIGKIFSNRPMAKGDTSGLAIYTISEFH